MDGRVTTLPARGDHRYLFALVGAFAFGWAMISASGAILNPLLPFIRAEFELSGAEAGLLTNCFTIPYMLMQIPSGVLADRLGAKRVLVAMTLLTALGMVAIGLWAYTLPVLLVYAVLHRLGAGVYYPTAFGVTNSTVPPAIRARASAFLVMGMALGAAIGAAFAVPLHDLGGGDWRYPFLVFGVLGLSLPLVFQFLMRPAPRARQSATGTVAEVFRDRSLVVLFAINFCTNYAFNAAIVWGPSFLGAERGFSPAMAGFYIALINLVALPAGMGTGVLSDRFGRKRLTMLLFPLAGLSLVLLAVTASPVLLLAGIVGFGLFGKWSSDGALAAWMGDHVSAKFGGTANAVYGVNNTIRMAGGVLAPVVTGALLDRTGTLTTGLLLASALLFAVVCLAPLVAELHGRRVARVAGANPKTTERTA